MADDLTHRYDTGDLTIIQEANEAWKRWQAGSPDKGQARLYRFASIRAREAGAPASQGGTRDSHWDGIATLNRGRAAVAASVTGDSDTGAWLLLQPFFELADRGDFESARDLLSLIPLLIPEDFSEPAGVWKRLYFEKLAFSHLWEARESGDFEPARAAYEAAYEVAKQAAKRGRRDSDYRGLLKVEGGLGLAQYLRDPTGSADSALVRMRRIELEARQNGFADVERWAAANVQVIRRSLLDSWVPFEVL